MTCQCLPQNLILDSGWTGPPKKVGQRFGRKQVFQESAQVSRYICTGLLVSFHSTSWKWGPHWATEHRHALWSRTLRSSFWRTSQYSNQDKVMAASFHPLGCCQTLIFWLCLCFMFCKRAMMKGLSDSILHTKAFYVDVPLSPEKLLPVPSAVIVYSMHHWLSEQRELQTLYDQHVLVIAGSLSSSVFTRASVFGVLLLPPDLLKAV